MTEVFVKLINKGLKSKDYYRFGVEVQDEATVRNLIDRLHEREGQRFEVYLEDIKKRILRRDTVVIVNGKNMVSFQGEDTVLSEGDLVVFMIAAVGG